jgi:hypothetical protein
VSSAKQNKTKQNIHTYIQITNEKQKEKKNKTSNNKNTKIKTEKQHLVVGSAIPSAASPTERQV